MRTHRAVTTGADTGLVDGLLTVAIDGQRHIDYVDELPRHSRNGPERNKARVRGAGSWDISDKERVVGMIRPCNEAGPWRADILEGCAGTGSHDLSQVNLHRTSLLPGIICSERWTRRIAYVTRYGGATH